jgi:hypothetical protein
MKRVTLHIERLVLKGFRPEDRHGIADGLQQELTRLLASPSNGEGLTKLASMSRLQLGSISFSPGASAQEVGAQLANAIAKGIWS